MGIFKKAAAAVAVTLAMAGSAMAAAPEGTNPGLFSFVYDGTHSVVTYLGTTLNSNLPGTIQNQSYNMDLTGFNSASTLYGVFSATNDGDAAIIATTLSTADFQSFVKSQSPTSNPNDPLIVSLLGSSFATAGFTAADFVTNVFNAAGQCAGGPVCAGASGTAKYWGTPDYSLALSFAAAAHPGTALDFYELMNSADVGSATKYSGQWTLALNGASSTLAYNAGSAPVPLPAAAWLLLSGIAGVGAIGRRRKAAAAAVAAA